MGKTSEERAATREKYEAEKRVKAKGAIMTLSSR